MKEQKTFYNMLKANAERRPDAVAIVYDTMEVTYAKLFEDAKNKALHLGKFGGARIAIFGPASYRWIVNMFGTILAGKDLVLVDFFLPHDSRLELLGKTDVDYTLTSTNQYILSDANSIIIRNAEKDEVEGLVYDEGTKEGNIIIFTATADECDKPVVLTTANVLSSAEEMNRKVECTESDIMLSQIPLHHELGFIYSLIWPLSCGAKVCIGRGLRHIDADTYYYRPNIFVGTPSMLEYLGKVNGFNRELSRVVIGGAGTPFKLFEQLSDRDMSVYSIYGMTETSGCVGVNELYDGSFTLFDASAVEISGDGEILVGGDCVMEGYYDDESATGRVIEGGMYHTGDFGRINSAGRLVITKRNPDIILLPTGEKISRVRTNEQLTALSGVAQAYITLCGNVLTAVIVPIDKEATEDTFKRRIDRYNESKGYRWEIQRIYISREPLPKDASGCIDEAAVQDLLTAKLKMA